MRVGLTGGIGSGKSTVAAIFAESGAVIIDADKIAHQVVMPGTPALAALVAEFGQEILTDSGELNRPGMAARVFEDATARKRLEAVVHPAVFTEIAKQEAAAPADAIVIHDIPLLAESGLASTFDAVIVVDTPVANQLARLVEQRGMTLAEAEARIASQASREERLAIATYVISNDADLVILKERALAVFSALSSRIVAE